MQLYDLFPKDEAPFCTRQIEEFRTDFRGLAVSHNVPLTLSTLLKLSPFIENGVSLFVTTPDNLGYDSVALSYLQEQGILFDLDKKKICHGDLFLDCSANLLGLGKPSMVAELTQTGVKKYQEASPTIPVVSIDDSYVKRLEDYFGTGDGFLRAYQEKISHSIRGKRFLIWGYGKVGKGIARSLLAEGAECLVVDLLAKNIEFAEKKGAIGILPSDEAALRQAVAHTDCLITASGVRSVISNHFLAEVIRDSSLTLVNMGAEDEFGPKFSQDRVLNRKIAFNFILREPTRMKYLDPVFYAHNRSAQLFLQGKLKEGVAVFPKEIDLEIVKEWETIWKIDTKEIFDL